MSTKKKAKRLARGEYWCGFSNGHPFLFTESLTREPCITVSKNRKRVAAHYQDVRRIRITEISK